jgi:hypothetical protein
MQSLQLMLCDLFGDIARWKIQVALVGLPLARPPGWQLINADDTESRNLVLSLTRCALSVQAAISVIILAFAYSSRVDTTTTTN